MELIITNETILKTRQWFADQCLLSILAEEKHKNENFEDFKFKKLLEHNQFLDGTFDHETFFILRAEVIQTGNLNFINLI